MSHLQRWQGGVGEALCLLETSIASAGVMAQPSELCLLTAAWGREEGCRAALRKGNQGLVCWVR